MGQSVPSISTAEVGCASGIMGAGIGYILAPRKYDLGQLLTLDKDVFESMFSKEAIDNKAAGSVKEIQSAREMIQKAAECNSAETKFIDLMRKPSLETAYKNIKSYIPKARAQSAMLIGAVTAFIGMAVHYISRPKN